MKRLIGLLVVAWITTATTSFAQDVRTYIPVNAYQHLETFKQEQARLFPDHPMPEYFPALAEHESCVGLKHSRCFNAKARLKSQREEGAGMPQITRTYRKDGSLRFDSLEGMRRAHPKELGELNWDNVYLRSDLQIRVLILMTRDNWKQFFMIKDELNRNLMTDSAYNSGPGAVREDRRVCGLRANCDPQIWFENVEKTCMRSRAAIYGNRSPCDINRHHVKDVVITRMPKYRQFYQKDN